MSTHAKTTKTSASPASVPATPAPASATTVDTSATAAPPVIFIAPPPANASIPPVPSGFEPTTGTNYRGVQPRKTELVALPLAVADVIRFVSYALVLGTTAPPQAEVLEVFQVTNQWSAMRNASSAWDTYCRDQEGIAWTAMRALMDRLKPAFELAAKTNPSLATSYAGLTALFGAKAASAQKGAATKKANKQDVAEGKAPTHGLVGKARQKAAAKAALAAQNAKPIAVPVAAPTLAAAGVEAPVVAGLAATAAASGGATGSNGAAH